jgi:hypothetical protein
MGLITGRHEYLATRAAQTFAAFGIERDKLVLGNAVKELPSARARTARSLTPFHIQRRTRDVLLEQIK